MSKTANLNEVYQSIGVRIGIQLELGNLDLAEAIFKQAIDSARAKREPASVYDMQLDETELPAQTVELLYGHGIFTVLDLVSCEPAALVSLSRVGESTYGQIRSALEALGLRVNPPPGMPKSKAQSMSAMREDGKTRREQVMEFMRIRDRPVSLMELADACNAGSPDIWKILDDEIKRGRVVKPCRGRYALAKAS